MGGWGRGGSSGAGGHAGAGWGQDSLVGCGSGTLGPVDGPTLFDADLRPAEVAAPAPLTVSAPARVGISSAPPRVSTAAAPPAPTLLVIDGDGLAHRAFHAYPTDRTPGPVHGFLALLAAVADQTPADGLVVGFDSRERSFRRERFPAYKAQRDDKDPGLLAVLFALPEALEQLGVTVVVPEGWEADDVSASAAAVAEANGWRCAIATSDRDAFCLVSDSTSVLRLRGRGSQVTVVTPQRLRREVGVAPHQYVEYSALRGDVSDNLEGVTGIGPTRAATLLKAFPTVAAAVADPLGCRSVLGAQLGQVLIDDLHAGEASVFRRNVELMQPRTDLPIDLAASRRRCHPERMAERLGAWGHGRLAGRMVSALATRPEQVPPPDAPPD